MTTHIRRVVITKRPTITFPPMVEGQDGWYLDSPNNRLLRGDNWIARDWFPKIIIPVDVQSGDLFTSDGKFHRIKLDLSRIPWWRRWLQRITYYIRRLGL